VVVGTLSTICDLSSSISTPALFVVGEVVSFSSQFQWVFHQKLHGRRIVILRSIDQSHSIMSSLTHLGAEVIHFPVLQFSKSQEGYGLINNNSLSQYDTLVFTSQNGVDYFFDALKDRKIDFRCLRKHRLCSIGEKTTEALTKRGIFPDWEAIPSTSEGMVALLHEQDEIQNIGLITSTIGGFTIQSLCKKEITRLPLYKTETPDHVFLAIEKDDWIVFTSPSSVRHFLEIYKEDTSSLTAFCIGPTTEKELSGSFAGTIIVADKASTEGLVESIIGVSTAHDI